ncbi:RNA polymerase sigma factor [Mesorhizobium sp. LSJC265A00]|nr:RNA polymerase sigma factor [Mesorhizobium sp. LSJC265A00]
MAGNLLPAMSSNVLIEVSDGDWIEELAMPAMSLPMPTAASSEMLLVRRALAREGNAFRIIMKTHNQRLYRIARGVVRNDAEAEDIVQEAYVRAFAHLDAFRGESSLATWLSRIVINEALGRLRKRRRTVAKNPQAEIIQFPLNPSDDPERTMAQRQILELVERATDSLPDVYRTVFVARVIEGLSIEETAELLGVRPETVKTRLHRARALVRKALDDQIGPVLLDAFPFAGRRCDRLTSAVMQRLGLES